jgi:AraC family transcriptional activator of tynA and feaB
MTYQTSTRTFQMRGLTPDVLSPVFAELEMLDAKQIHGEYAVSDLQGMRLVRSTTHGGNFQVVRSNLHVKRSSASFIFICLPIGGETTLQQNERVCALSTGDFGILDSRSEYKIDVSDYSDVLWLRVEAMEMEQRLGKVSNVTARRIDGSGGLGLVASGFITSIASQANTLNSSAPIKLGSIAMDLVSAATASYNETTFLDRFRSSRRILERAREYVELHLGEEALSPREIAEAVGISTRYLSEIFAAQGVSPMGWVMRRRLECCQESLQKHPWSPGIITYIAFQHGFSNVSSFNRAFKREFGKTPRDCMYLNV